MEKIEVPNITNFTLVDRELCRLHKMVEEGKEVTKAIELIERIVTALTTSTKWLVNLGSDT